MTLLLLNLDKFRAPTPPELAHLFLQESQISVNGIWRIRNELKPADLYVYLYAKFGEPNGLQNFFRHNSSDNLIHWEWTLQHSRGLLSFQGMNLRTEVRFSGRWEFEKFDRDQLIRFIKNDFSNYGKEMSRIRSEVLEDWETFLNPYHQMRSCIDSMREALNALAIDADNDRFDDPETLSDMRNVTARSGAISKKYAKAFELTTSLRVLAPILAESFLNLLMFSLMKPEIRANERLREAAIREQIDIKVQSIHLKCDGFKEGIDWTSPACRAYNKVISERNDTLHGNVVISKLKTGEIYFNDKVPVFKEYSGFWEKTLRASLRDSGYYELEDTLKAVDEFIEYVLACLEPNVRSFFEYIMGRRELGRNRKNGRLGVLLPEHTVDLYMGPNIGVKHDGR